MTLYAAVIPHNTYDSEFYQSVIAIHSNEHAKAQQVSFFVTLNLKHSFITLNGGYLQASVYT